jgi:hypothetical protein
MIFGKGMLFDLAFDDEPTMIFVRDEEVAEVTAEPPALPFPLLREKRDPEPEAAVVFELVAPRRRAARVCA